MFLKFQLVFIKFSTKNRKWFQINYPVDTAFGILSKILQVGIHKNVNCIIFLPNYVTLSFTSKGKFVNTPKGHLLKKIKENNENINTRLRFNDKCKRF